MIELKPIEERHLPLIKRWRNSPSVMPYCRQYRSLTTKDMDIWYENITRDRVYNLIDDLFLITIANEKDKRNFIDNELIGVGGYVRIDWRNRRAELSFYVGEDDYRTEKIITEALMAILHYGLATLNLWKISFPCYSFNPQIPIYEKIMKREYVCRKEYYYEGRYWDRIVLVSYGVTDVPTLNFTSSLGQSKRTSGAENIIED